MKKIITAGFAILMLSGCLSEGLVEKNERCSSFKDEIESNNNALGYPVGSDHFYFYAIKDLFFSQKLNTCIFVQEEHFNDGPVEVMNKYIVNDFYNNEELASFVIREQRNYTGDLSSYEEYISDLKGE